MRTTFFDIEGPALLEPIVFSDERGYFFESYNKEKFKNALGFNPNFVQDNQSKSQKGVLRGLHFQTPPYEQGKLVSVIRGSVLDIALDIRKNSQTYGQYVSAILKGETGHMLWIPSGFAHGFLTLEDDTIFSYKCTNFYNHNSEGAIRWDDPKLGIDWNLNGLEPLLSGKDKSAESFSTFVSPF